METAKQKAADAAAAARAGAEKTKATVGGTAEKMTSHGEFEKELAEQRKEGRKTEAELRKEEAQAHNEAQKLANTAAKRTTNT